MSFLVSASISTSDRLAAAAGDGLRDTDGGRVAEPRLALGVCATAAVASVGAGVTAGEWIGRCESESSWPLLAARRRSWRTWREKDKQGSTTLAGRRNGLLNSQDLYECVSFLVY